MLILRMILNQDLTRVNISKDHPATAVGFKVGANKKVVGMMKDETAGAEISEFAGLRAKCYALRVERG
jgi:hypothetical protein